MTKDKEASLTRYAQELINRQTAPLSNKHQQRGSQAGLMQYLERELKAVKEQLAAAKL